MTAEGTLREALARDPDDAAAADALARELLTAGRAAEALQLTGPRVADTDRDSLLVTHIEALRQLDRAKEALPTLERLAARLPRDGYVQQEYAFGLVTEARYADAESVLRAVLDGGFEHPFAWQMLGAALMGLNRFDDAEAAFRSALRLAPGDFGAHRDLAYLVWRRTGDVDAACEAMDPIIAASADQGLRLIKARLLESTGDIRGAYALVAETGRNPALEVAAAQMAVGLNPDRAVEHARAALTVAPEDPAVLAVAAEAHLAAGRPSEALALAETLRRIAPLNQHGVALAATAWRLLGDARYGELFDYDALVQAETIETPAGWDSRQAYLADLAVALQALHPFHGHPVGQSIRGGSQTLQPLEQSADPAIRAFFEAIDRPVRRYIARLADAPEPLRSRIRDGYAVAGAWSVRLQPGGLHVSHLHPAGWISSAFYVSLPAEASAEGRRGWLAFGKPGIPTAPRLASEHFVRPEPGLLVLFPSYMWHGTTPFGGDQARLTIAFDVAPA